MKRLLLCFFSLVFFFFFANNAFAQASPSPVSPEESFTFFEKVERWYDNNMGYGAIMGLMTVESSVIPLPSESVVPPAAYVASKPESDMNIYLVVLFATIGAVCGALINYTLSYFLGRPIIYKFADSKLGHLCLLNKEKMQNAEEYFNKHGKTSTFIGRLIPGVRHLISIPAGLSKMNLFAFVLYTFIGAGLWNCILALLGYLAQGQADLIKKYSAELSYGLVAVVGIIAVFLVVKSVLKKRKKNLD